MNHSKRNPALDLLRVGAILWVIVHQLTSDRYLTRNAGSWVARICDAGQAGVDLFFVLSGYLIGSIILKEINQSGQLNVPRFWYRRWMRTLPAYFAIMALIATLDLLFSRDKSWPNFPAYLVFLQNYWNPTGEMRFPWSWSLCVEEWFYLLFPLLAVVCLRRFSKTSAERIFFGLAATTFAISLVSRSVVMMGEEGNDSVFSVYGLTHCRLDGLAVGIFLSALPKSRANLWTGIAVALAVIGIGLFIIMDKPRVLKIHSFAIWAVLFGVVTYGAISDHRLTRLRIPGMAHFADLAYALYLTHPIFSIGVFNLMPRAHAALQIVVICAGTLMASLMLRLFVELPFLNIRDRKGKLPTSEAETNPIVTAEDNLFAPREVATQK